MRTGTGLTADTTSLMGAATFGALAALITLLKFEFAFPLLPFLKFDLAEIPDIMAFLVFGPVVGILTSVIHWEVLTLVSGNPFGAALKFAAVLTTLLGVWAGGRVYQRIANQNSSLPRALFSISVSGAIFRVGLMTIINFFAILYVAPLIGLNYIAFAKATLQTTLGVTMVGTGEILAWTLAVIAVFNVLHSLLTLIPSDLIASPLALRAPNIGRAGMWIQRFVHREPSAPRVMLD